ncbi:MAG: DUF4438 domain-containing protein [Erysipelotrichaceae bacterium]
MFQNKNKLVKMAVAGKIHHPTMPASLYWSGYDGLSRCENGTGSITYNFQIGDSCMDLEGDHVEPGVSLRNENDKENNAIMGLACIGNDAIVLSGDAKGRKGVVTGKHGGVEHTMISFDEETLELLAIDDRILIKTYGNGLKFQDYATKILNIDPTTLEKLLALVPQSGLKLQVPVTHIVPAHLMGSGLGSSNSFSDYDIMTQDAAEVARFHLDTLRFGDIVAIEDHDTFYGPHFKKGALSIGVIVHSDSKSAGHGPGVCVILSGNTAELECVLHKDANLTTLFR